MKPQICLTTVWSICSFLTATCLCSWRWAENKHSELAYSWNYKLLDQPEERLIRIRPRGSPLHPLWDPDPHSFVPMICLFVTGCNVNEGCGHTEDVFVLWQSRPVWRPNHRSDHRQRSTPTLKHWTKNLQFNSEASTNGNKTNKQIAQTVFGFHTFDE